MKKILITEDQPAISNLMSDLFKAKGYDVDLATNGSVGLDLLRKNSYDCILLDLKMPEMDGLQVLQKLKDEQITTGPILVFSSVSYPYAREKALGFGIKAFVDKDKIQPLEVLDLVEKTVSESQEA